MAEIGIPELEERARLESGLRNNAYYDPAQILRYLNAGGAELHDLFTAANQHYNVREFDFTTTGPDDAIITLPVDFQQGHSLDIYPGTNQARTIRYLSNWLNRNQTVGTTVFTASGNDPIYTFLDNKLRFYPPQSVPSAPFKLYYTPMWTTLLPEVSRTFAIDPADTPLVPGPGPGPGAWVFANGAFTSDIPVDGSARLTPTFVPPNDPFNGTYFINAVVSPTLVSVSNLASTAGYSNPAGGSATLVYQPIGTRSTLPANMTPWSEYLVVYAAIAINIDRQRPVGELERKLNALKARVASILGNRQEEPQQPPLTRGTGGWLEGWGGGGGLD